MALWCFSRLKEMLAQADNVTVEELDIISGKYGGAENMFQMVRANPTVLNQFLGECQSVRPLLQFAKAIHFLCFLFLLTPLLILDIISIRY